MEATKTEKTVGAESIVAAVVRVPGVKVDRDKFLAEMFAGEGAGLQTVLELGPIGAGVTQERLAAMAKKLILKRTGQSSAASFAAGIPGGLAMAATIPADVLQFFGMALRLAQELSYLYGAQDLWADGKIDDEKIRDQLLLYCGVMFGVSGAVSGVRVLSTQIAKTTLKRLPQKALTKTFWFPVIKQIGKAIGVKITKSTVAKGVAKAVPVLGGVVSGGLNFASMLPMANRLQAAFDSAAFSYSQEDLENDIIEIEKMAEEGPGPGEEPGRKAITAKGKKKAAERISNILSERMQRNGGRKSVDSVDMIARLAALKEDGIITQEEFDTKKRELLEKL